MIHARLVDKTVKPLFSWLKDLRQEDIKECGRVVNRTMAQTHQLYEMYREFQTSDEAVAIRATQA